MTLKRLQLFFGAVIAAAFLAMGVFQLDSYSDPRGTTAQLLSGLLCMLIAPTLVYATFHITDGLNAAATRQKKRLEEQFRNKQQ